MTVISKTSAVFVVAFFALPHAVNTQEAYDPAFYCEDKGKFLSDYDCILITVSYEYDEQQWGNDYHFAGVVNPLDAYRIESVAT